MLDILIYRKEIHTKWAANSTLTLTPVRQMTKVRTSNFRRICERHFHSNTCLGVL